ncbi:MAG: hypothetical protein ACXV5F_08360 [Halobacteriota archaeon]
MGIAIGDLFCGGFFDMPEAGGSNIEIAHKLSEGNQKKPRSSRFKLEIEILEVIILALVAISTAYSGYQAAQWDGHQALLYAQASSLNVKGNELITSDGQDLLFNTNTLNAWLNAEMQGNQTAAKFYENRFLPEYKIAFDAWVKLDPLNNSSAPPGPRYMPEYHSAKLEEGNNLTAAAGSKIIEGTNDRSIADSYVRSTVFLATVLVLIVLSQRFEIQSVRRALVVLSLVLLVFGIGSLLVLPAIF